MTGIQVRTGYMHAPTVGSINVVGIFVHPLYNPFTHENDLAVLRLATNITFTHLVSPINLVSRIAPVTSNVQVVGFNWLANAPQANVTLQMITQVVRTRAVCRQEITPSMTCAQSNTVAQGTCQVSYFFEIQSGKI